MTARIKEVQTAAEAEAVATFFRTIWIGEDDVAPLDLILAVVHVGGFCAYVADESGLQAASFGFLGTFEGQSVLHSHVTASRQPGLGFELKLFQRDWAARRGIAGITWTFDPLVRRNAVFNFEKLQATAVEYLPNFYGSMTDSINAGDESDRLFVYWPTAAASSDPSSPSSDAIWVELPADVEALRRTDLPATLQWRKTVREALQPKLDSGWVIRRMNPERTAVLIEPPANRN